MTSRLEDDLIRAGQILRSATGASIVILNETFASTTPATPASWARGC